MAVSCPDALCGVTAQERRNCALGKETAHARSVQHNAALHKWKSGGNAKKNTSIFEEPRYA